MDMRTERPRTAGRIQPSGRLTPSMHNNANGGRRKAIPVPPPRVPTPMPPANNNPPRNNANLVQTPPIVLVHKKESRENAARIAKRYLDDNMQQAWINPRLISMINMQAVTSTDYDTSHFTGNFNQVDINGYNCKPFEDKYKPPPQQIVKYSDEYAEYGRNSVRMGLSSRLAMRHRQENRTKLDQHYVRSHSQPEKQHHSSQEARSKSQDSRELTFYQIDPPLKHENSHGKSQRFMNEKGKNELTFYEIDVPIHREKMKEVRFSQPEKIEKRDKVISSKHSHGKLIVQEDAKPITQTPVYHLNGTQPDVCDLPNYYRNTSNVYTEPPKYRHFFEKPPKYQETPPKSDPPPKYHQDPPKYSEVTRKLDDPKTVQEERVRRPGYVVGGNGGGIVGEPKRGTTVPLGTMSEAPVNLASITPAVRETTRGTGVLLGISTRHRYANKTDLLYANNNNNNNNNNREEYQDCTLNNGENVRNSEYVKIAAYQHQSVRGSGAAEMSDNSKFKGTVNAILKVNEVIQGRPCEKSVLKIEKPKGLISDKMKIVQDPVYKHDSSKIKAAHELSHAKNAQSYKVENIKYYGELKGYDFKSYGTIDKPAAVHEKFHQPVTEKSCHQLGHEKTLINAQGEKSVYSDKYSEHVYHKPTHLKSHNPFQTYKEAKYAYNVNGTPGTPGQANAAAVFFARAAQKLNLSSSPHRRRRSGDENSVTDELLMFPNGYAALLLKSPPPAPPALLRRIGVKELSGVGKVKVMLRVSAGDGGSFFSADKRKKQVTLIDPASAQTSSAEDRRPTVAAPKMFAFDAIFTEDDSQTEICSSALTDVIHAVINGTDGCLFCFGHAGLGKTHTMLGTPEAGHTLGAIPCAITWLFRGISEQRQKTGARFSVRVSCVELTTGQQQLRDLLAAYSNDSEHSPGVYLRDDPLFGTLQLQQHSELRAPTAERAAFYLDAAAAGRRRDDGDAHMLYTLHVYQYSVAGKGGVAGGRSRLHLMDLGNCDRGKSSGGIPLSGLGNILLTIFNGQKHLPYKDHKLTQLLKECLSSLTCHAAMIAHVSPNAQHYSDTLTTVQLASRIHRMRRRKIRFISGGIQAPGSGGSSGEEAARQNSECDPSSSDLSADTVIYVGPSADDATDGEHPPVYIPSLNSGDNRCAMGRVLRGSVAEKPCRIPEERSPVHKATKVVKALTQTASKQTSPAHIATPKCSPGRKSISTKVPAKVTDSPTSKIPVPTTVGTSEERWIDGPRISKSKVAEARHLLKDNTHKRETWIDGPMQAPATPAVHSHSSSNYGFMDSHKKSMIRKWVEIQSSQIQRSKHNAAVRAESKSTTSCNSAQFREMTTFKTCDDDQTSLSTTESDSIKANDIEDITEKLGAKLSLMNVRSNTDSGLDMTTSPAFDSSLERSKLDLADDEDDDEEIVVPPPLPLIEPLSNGVSREVSMESLNMSHKDLPSRQSVSSEEEILEIVEMEDVEPVPMQDSCLQVTEEDIALCMGLGENPLPESDQEEHPLRILSQENLTIVSTFVDTMSVMSDNDRYRPHFSPSMGGTSMLHRPYFDHEDFLEQESKHKFDQLARLRELYQSKLALANVSNSVTYQRENSSSNSNRETPSTTAFRPPSRCQSLSLSDVMFNDNASNHGSIYSEPAYIAGKPEQEKICDNCRQSMSRPATASYWYPSSVAHLASPRKYCAKLGDCNISSLRHPDGASNPNLKEEIERIPGNGASGSDPEEEYVEAKKLFATTERSKRTVTGKSDIEEELQLSNDSPAPLQLTIPSSTPFTGRMQHKILSGSSLGLNKDDYDSGADSTSRVAKLSPATLSRHRAESSGYDSIVRDSETSSIASDSSRQTSGLHEHQAVERPVAGFVQRPQAPDRSVAILEYTGEDVAILDRRARMRSEPHGTMSKIHSLRLRQRLLKVELKEAKERLMVPDNRWDYGLYVEDNMDWKHPSFLEALTVETHILQKRVNACKSHVLLVTCFDSRPRHFAYSAESSGPKTT